MRGRGCGNGFIHCREGDLLFVLMVEFDLVYVSGQRNWLGVFVGASKFIFILEWESYLSRFLFAGRNDSFLVGG